MEKRVFNFSAGPATLPLPVLQEAQRDLLSLPGAGMSVLEISHRSTWFDEIHSEAEHNLRLLLGLPDHFRVLFLQGGASLQFATVPMSFLKDSGRSADYLITGSWGTKALKEAQREGSVRVAWNGKEENFVRAPVSGDYRPDPDAVYLHFTSNETIQGVQFADEPDSGEVPLVCDASSEFLARPINVERYGLIYAGAQKNAGPAGVTMVIIREDFLDQAREGLPSVLDYRILSQNNSLYNTPPVFAVYMVKLVTKWILDEVGGLDHMQLRNREKAEILYEAVDRSEGFYQGHARPGSRSIMNVTWRLATEDLEKKFVAEARQEGLLELKGHRSVGGIRASIYNAMPLKGVRSLAAFMEDFRSRHSS